MPTKRKKESYKAGAKDCCQTPAYAIEPLIPYLRPGARIWEPACGRRNLVDALVKANFECLGTDLLKGQNFLECEPYIDCDYIITNPPYSSPLKGKFIARCYALGKPWALLVPCDSIGMKSFQKYARVYGFEMMLLDDRVDFEMPQKGYNGGGANYSVMWLCWKILGQPFVYGHLNKPKRSKPTPEGQMELLTPASLQSNMS